jgi:hypothetical protein
MEAPSRSAVLDAAVTRLWRDVRETCCFCASVFGDGGREEQILRRIGELANHFGIPAETVVVTAVNVFFADSGVGA